MSEPMNTPGRIERPESIAARELTERVWIIGNRLTGSPWEKKLEIQHILMDAMQPPASHSAVELADLVEAKLRPMANAGANARIKAILPLIQAHTEQAAPSVLREALQEVSEILALIDADGERAKTFNGSAQTSTEDALVRDLCEVYGYGAVMDSAARQWFSKDPVGAFVIGSCAGLVRPLKAKVAAALASTAPADAGEVK